MNGKKQISCLLIIVTIFSIMFGFNACTKKVPSTKAVCLLIGNTNNVAVAGTGLFEDYLKDDANAVSDCSVIILDGDPKLGNQYQLKFSNKKTVDSSSGMTRRRIREIQNIWPEQNEVDIIKGLRAAAAELENASLQDKELLIYSSGISTVGDFNLVDDPDLVYEEPKKVVYKLQQTLKNINLKGVKVVWSGINEVDGAQEEMTAYEANNLKDIYTRILIRCGVNKNDIEFRDYSRDSAEMEEKNQTLYRLDSLKDRAEMEKISVTPVDFRGYIEIDENEVKFLSNSNGFVNETTALRALKKYAKKIKKYHLDANKIYIIGMTADADTNKACLRRSQMRADRIRDIFIKEGLDADNLSAIGIGKYDVGTLRIKDEKEPSAKNRRVVIMLADSKEGKEFENDWSNFSTERLD